MTDYLNRAHALGERFAAFAKLPMFPLVPGSKTPRVPDWQHVATADEVDRLYQFNSDDNVGVLLGGTDGLLVLDVDVRDGKPGKRGLRQLLEQHGRFPGTLTVKTASGGVHIYFRGCPARRRVGVLAPGVDVLGEDSYVVGPGSVLADGIYEVVTPGPIAEAPAWLRAWVAEHASAAGRKKRRQDDGDWLILDQDNDVLRARAMLRTIPDVDLPERGRRNDVLYALCAKLGDYGLSTEMAADLLAAEWNGRLTHPLDAGEIERTAENANQYRQEPLGVASVANEFAGVSLLDEPAPTLPKAGRRLMTLADLRKARSMPLRELEAIPRIRWLVPNMMARGIVSGIVGAPGGGKSAFGLTLAQAIASGRSEFAGIEIREHGNVLVINAEDPRDIAEARHIAVCRGESFDRYSAPHETILACGLDDGARPCIAVADNRGNVTYTQLVADLQSFVTEANCAAVIVDPFVSTHAVNENDNRQIDLAVDAWRQLAANTGCSVMLVHHTRKPGASEQGRAATNARGASSFTGALRVQLDVSGPDDKEVETYGIADHERADYMRLEVVKSNYGPTGRVTWMHRRVIADAGIAMKVVELKPKSNDLFDAVFTSLYDMIPNDGMSAREAHAQLSEDFATAMWFEKKGGGTLTAKGAIRRLEKAFATPQISGDKTIWYSVEEKLLRRREG